MRKILYVFGGEEASGAEIVIERLMQYNSSVIPMLMIAPGKYSTNLLKEKKSYNIIVNERLKKLKRANTNILKYIWRALSNYFIVSYKVFQCIRSNKIDVVHANTVVPASYLIPCLIWCKLTKPRVRFVWSDHDLKYYSKIDHVLANLLVKLYDRTLVVSNAVKSKYKDRKNVITLYNGIDVQMCQSSEELRFLFRKQYNIPEKAKVFAIIGHIIKRKGVKELLETYVTITKDCQEPPYLLIIGDGVSIEQTYHKEIEKIASGINNVVLTGRISNMAFAYNGVDFVINNSLDEGGEPLGTTILESQAYKKVTLVSNVGGSSEIVNQSNGIVYDTGNYTLKYAIERAIKMGEVEYKALSLAAYTNIVERFNIEQMVIAYNRLLIDL